MTDDQDAFFSSPEFQRFFARSTQSVVIKANPPFFTMLAASDQFVGISGIPREGIVGKNLFDVFPDNISDPSGKLSVYKAFVEVIDTRKRVDLPVYRYDIYVAAEDKQLPFYWSNNNEPILNADGSAVTYIVNTTTNITETVLLEQRESESIRHALHLEQRINQMFIKAPIAMVLLSRDEYIIEYANDMMCSMWNKGIAADVLGRSIFHVIEELEASGLRAVYDNVVESGLPYFSTEVPVAYNREGQVKTYWFDIHMEPVFDVFNKVTGLMILTNDVTPFVTTRRQIEASEERLRMASAATGMGSFDVDLQTWQIIHSAELARIFGFPEDQAVAWDDLVKRVL